MLAFKFYEFLVLTDLPNSCLESQSSGTTVMPNAFSNNNLKQYISTELKALKKQNFGSHCSPRTSILSISGQKKKKASLLRQRPVWS